MLVGPVDLWHGARTWRNVRERHATRRYRMVSKRGIRAPNAASCDAVIGQPICDADNVGAGG